MIFRKAAGQRHAGQGNRRRELLASVLVLLILTVFLVPTGGHAQGRPYKLEGLQGGTLGPADFAQGGGDRRGLGILVSALPQHRLAGRRHRSDLGLASQGHHGEFPGRSRRSGGFLVWWTTQGACLSGSEWRFFKGSLGNQSSGAGDLQGWRHSLFGQALPRPGLHHLPDPGLSPALPSAGSGAVVSCP